MLGTGEGKRVCDRDWVGMYEELLGRIRRYYDKNWVVSRIIGYVIQTRGYVSEDKRVCDRDWVDMC